VTAVDFNPWASVLAVAWSPDGQTIALSAGGSVRLLDAETLAESSRWQPGATTGSLAFSPDIQMLAAGSRDGQVRIWEVTSGKLVQTIQAHKKGVNRVVFHPLGNPLASGGNDAVARLWDIKSGERLAQMIGGTYAVPSLAFTQQGKNLAIVNGNVIRLREVASGRFVQTIHAKEGIYSLAVSPDESIIASGGVTGDVESWDSLTGEARIRYLRQSASPGSLPVLIWSLVFSPDGSVLAAAGSDALIRVWETQTGELLVTLPGHDNSVTSLAFSPDGRRLVSGSLDGTLRLWGIR
jgi:WD40 repeat protein